MKQLKTILTAFLLLFTATSFAQTTQPTFEETARWLESKHASLRSGSEVASWQLKVDDEGIKEVCKDKNCVSYRQKGWQYITNIICSKSSGGGWSIGVISTSGYSEYDATNGTKEEKFAHSNLGFWIGNDETEAKKFLKALRHAATLKGAKLVKEDLFGE